MMYCARMLALHPEAQDKLYKEIQKVIGDRLPDYNGIANLHYALCVMYETMRLFPVIGSLNAMVAERKDTSLLGKYDVPHEARLGMDFWCVHRNEKYWGETVNHFDPSRFDMRTGENKDWYSPDGKVHIPVRGAWFGFSEGPRACIGTSS